MRWMPPPTPPRRNDLITGRFKGDLQLAVWRQRRGFSSQLHNDPSTLGFSEDKLAYLLLEIESRRLGSRRAGLRGSARTDVQNASRQLADHLYDAMVELTPKLSAPELDPNDKVGTLAHIFAQPEIQDFLLSWQSQRSERARGPHPFDAGAKALLCLMGMTKHNHATAAYQDLYEMPRLRQMFADAELAAARRNGLPDPDAFTLALYEGTTGRVPQLAVRGSTRPLALRAKARMFKALCELYPDAGFGKRLLIDGHLLPAWCRQVGKGRTDQEEAARRATTPHAGARLILRTSSGKRDLDPADTVPARALMGSGDFARGYYYVCIIDQASGWPLVSQLIDASTDEAEALIPLLSDLYRYYDFIEPQYIAGDGAWDEQWAHRTCELFYGLTPVFRHTDRSSAWTDTTSDSIRGFSHEGRPTCREHNRALQFDRLERPTREGLRPGQGAPGHPDSDRFRRELERREAQFRVRFRDTHGPDHSRPTLRAMLDWRRLNGVPRYPEGRPDLYALRQALMVRLRNQMEGHFSRLKSAVALGTHDADRVRFQDMATVEALFQLAELRITALSLAAERAHCQQPADPLPGDAPLGPLPVKGSGGGRTARGATNAAASRQRGSSLQRRTTRATDAAVQTTAGGVPLPRRRRQPAASEPEPHVIPSALAATQLPNAVQVTQPHVHEPGTRTAARAAEASNVVVVDFLARRRAPLGDGLDVQPHEGDHHGR